MASNNFFRWKKGFTLIELLVVIAIIAILSVVIVLTLNPAELLRQSRDANRISDIATLQSSIGLYQTDMGGAGVMGNSNFIYISLPDTTSTCTNIGLPALPSTSSYACSSSTSSRLVNGQGWAPLNFTLISSGAPFGSLPIDPINTSSSGLFYTYTTNGNQYQIIALLESQKYKQNINGSLGTGVDVGGSNVGTAPVGWWGMNEGVGSTTIDLSGNGNAGTWNGTPTAGSYYTAGKVGNWAGAFNGTNNWINSFSQSISPAGTSKTVCAWMNAASSTHTGGIVSTRPIGGAANGWSMRFNNGSYVSFYLLGATGNVQIGISINAWTHMCGTYDLPSQVLALYKNGAFITSTSSLPETASANKGDIGSESESNVFLGSLDDVRIYNRALSAAEIQAIYNVGK